MYDPDEIEEEQREREKRNKINADFKQFTTRVQVRGCMFHHKTHPVPCVVRLLVQLNSGAGSCGCALAFCCCCCAVLRLQPDIV
jgi:hypothetical protein